MTDSRNFLLNTDYPLDKIIYMTSGSFTVPSGGGLGASQSVAHGLDFVPLMCGNWSNDSDFSSTKEMAIYEYGDLDGMQAYCYADGTNVTVSSINYGSSDKTIYYRVYGFMPSNVNDTAPSTSSASDDFVLNTDYNYTKLLAEEYHDASSGNVTITHSLGYRPQVIAWRADDPTFVFQENVAGYVNITTSNIVLTGGSGEKYHIRVYADGQV